MKVVDSRLTPPRSLHGKKISRSCRPPLAGYSVNLWVGGGVGVCCWDTKTLSLHQAAISLFLQPYSRLGKKKPYPIPD